MTGPPAAARPSRERSGARPHRGSSAGRASRPDRRRTGPTRPPSDGVRPISADQWRAVRAVLPAPARCGRRRSTDLSEVVAAIDLHWQTGCPWRRLPATFPPWQTVYGYFRTWLRDGTLRELRGVLKPPKPSELPPWGGKKGESDR